MARYNFLMSDKRVTEVLQHANISASYMMSNVFHRLWLCWCDFRTYNQFSIM